MTVEDDRQISDKNDQDRQRTILLAANMATECRKPTDAEEQQVRAYVIVAVSEKTETVHVSHMMHKSDLIVMLQHLNDLYADLLTDLREDLREQERQKRNDHEED